MSVLLFVDESGQDRRDSPYEVLAGLAIADRDLWPFITAVQQAELEYFGRRYASAGRELKGKALLKRKVFRLAAQLPAFELEERRVLSVRCLNEGESAGRRELTALAQAKLALVREVFHICSRFHCSAFASITDREAPRPMDDFLRKDYAYLFERFFYFLEDRGQEVLGLVVFDELDKARSRILIDQMERYFRETWTGRSRSRLVIPEPFFVHSDLTTAIQVVDLLAYVVAWGVKVGTMKKPSHPELGELGDLVCRLRYRTRRRSYDIWSFAHLKDLRPRDARVVPEETPGIKQKPMGAVTPRKGST